MTHEDRSKLRGKINDLRQDLDSVRSKAERLGLELELAKLEERLENDVLLWSQLEDVIDDMEEASMSGTLSDNFLEECFDFNAKVITVGRHTFKMTRLL
jgi:predicted nuclease with TOPRIM domain